MGMGKAFGMRAMISLRVGSDIEANRIDLAGLLGKQQIHHSFEVFLTGEISAGVT